MLAIDFPEANTTFTKPKSMTDAECSDLRAFVGVSKVGHRFINTVWMPNKEDIEAINAGRPIILHMLADVLCPVALFTCDENGEINE